MFCQYCGTEIEDDVLFCPKCGEKVEENTQAWQHENQQQDRNEQPRDTEPFNPVLPQKKSMGGFAVFMIFVLIALLIVGGIGFTVWRFAHKTEAAVEQIDEYTEEQYEDAFAETFGEENGKAGKEAVDSTDVDIDAFDTQDKNGKETKTAEANGTNGYVIADSNTRLLTNTDVSGLSLKEINYAKNEIYARHGRKFDSPELQKYFGGKSWYHGTISPADFSENLLSDVEKKNAEFLSNVEFGRNPDGYKLDAN